MSGVYTCQMQLNVSGTSIRRFKVLSFSYIQSALQMNKFENIRDDNNYYNNDNKKVITTIICEFLICTDHIIA